MPFWVEMVRTMLPGFPLEQVTLELVGVTKGPLLGAPTTFAVTLIVPENPFRDVSVIVDVPDDPLAMFRDVVEAVSWKSTTLTVTVAVWTVGPLVPVIVTL